SILNAITPSARVQPLIGAVKLAGVLIRSHSESCRALAGFLANFDDVLGVLEFDERELIEEPVAAEEAVSGFGKLRHKADDGPEGGTAYAANLDLNRVEVNWSALAGDNTAHVADAVCRSECNAQDLCKFGWEDVAI